MNIEITIERSSYYEEDITKLLRDIGSRTVHIMEGLGIEQITHRYEQDVTTIFGRIKNEEEMLYIEDLMFIIYRVEIECSWKQIKELPVPKFTSNDHRPLMEDGVGIK